MISIKRSLGIALVLLGTTFSSLSFGKSNGGAEPLNLRKFDFAASLVAQFTGIRYAGVLASWTPSYRLTNEVELHGNLGLGFQGGQGVGFLVIDAAVTGSYAFNEQFYGEVGLGLQTWASNGGALFSIPLRAGYVFSEAMELFSSILFEKAYLAYTILPSASAHIFGLGAGFTF